MAIFVSPITQLHRTGLGVERGSHACRTRSQLRCQPQHDFEASLNAIPTLQEYLKRRWSAFMRANFVNCWHMNDDESQAMWKIYAGENAGIAVQSTVGRLIKALSKDSWPIHIDEITYVDRSQYMRQWKGTSRSPYMYKRKEFEYERR